VGKTDILLVRHDDQVYALGAYCTHNGAPLAQGVLHGDQIICPWHNAYFNIETGDQEEPPGLNSLPHYLVKIENNQVIVTVLDSQKGMKVTVVSPASLPFEEILGTELGQLFYQVHQEQGVTFQMGRTVTQLEGESAVQAVALDNGDRLSADLVVAGIGVQPVTNCNSMG
jgi:nitrite reductase/ring-hydroxylating ferredoxin subunit